MAALRAEREDVVRAKLGIFKGIEGSYKIAGKLGDGTQTGQIMGTCVHQIYQSEA